MVIKCDNARVRFKNFNLHQQRISKGDVTIAHYLEVEFNNLYVTISYIFQVDIDTLESRPVKILVFNRDEVVEVECEDNVRLTKQSEVKC